MRQFLMGNEVLAKAAADAGAEIMFSYPITPASEIFETWVKFCQKENHLSYLQSEDEMAAGFSALGATLAGVKAFTATAGPGNVLMQDAFSMAEALRIPLVAMIIQRGGLSTSTVIYSQEEVRLTCFGGNGEGFRIVYSTSNLQELYSYTLKSFAVAWKYRWPTFILADGYQGKMKGEMDTEDKIQDTGGKIQDIRDKSKTAILKSGVNLRNCYNLEEEIGQIINNYSQEYTQVRRDIEEHDTYLTDDAQTIIVAHGIVAAAAKEAVTELRERGLKVGLFRPITLRPFPQTAKVILKNAQKVITFESALSQLAQLLKSEIYGLDVPILEVNKPGVGFTPEEIANTVKQIK